MNTTTPIMHYVILAKVRRVRGGQTVEVVNMGEVNADWMKTCANVAREEGFHLLYELRSPPDMAEVAQRVRDNKLSGIDDLIQLWVLRQP